MDTQDFHSLRAKRQQLVGDSQSLNNGSLFFLPLTTKEILKTYPNPIEDEQYARELASMYRSDLILFCSDYERYLVKNKFHLSNTGLISFFYSMHERQKIKKKSFERKKNFVWIGIMILIKKIW